MVSASGRSVTLRCDGYEAEIVEVGGGLRALRRDGVDIVGGYGPDEQCWAGRGQLLVPWPNRIQDGSYDFEGAHYQLPLSEPANLNASHGLVRWVNWSLVDETKSAAAWGYRLHPQPGYPFTLDLTAAYDVTSDGLRVDISATNIGTTAAPYGHGAHPYLTVGKRLDECELTLPATTRAEVDARGIPGETHAVEGGPYDFRAPRLIGTASFDNAFSDLERAGGGTTVALRDPASDRRVTLTADAAYPWLQIFSGDALPRLARMGLAVEPMTCPANAFRTGQDLIVLQPGETHRAGFSIA